MNGQVHGGKKSNNYNINMATREEINVWAGNVDSELTAIFKTQEFNNLLISPQYDTLNTTVQGYPTDWKKVNNVYVGNHTKQYNKELSLLKCRSIFIPKFLIYKTQGYKDTVSRWFVVAWNINMKNQYNVITSLSGFRTLKEAKHYVDVEAYEFDRLK